MGLVYNIESSLISLNHRSGLFDINLSCKPQDTKRVVAEVMKLVNDFLKNGITDAELDLEKSDFKASRGCMLVRLLIQHAKLCMILCV